MKLSTQARRVWCFDVEARPGPWGGGDFTFKHLLSIAGGPPVHYLGPGFSAIELEHFIAPLRRPDEVLVVTHNGPRYDLPFLNG